MPPSRATRLDQLLVARGLARSRTQAQALLREGRVVVDGVPVTKASTPVLAGTPVGLSDDPGDGPESAWIDRGWVGRGAVKLDHALTRWQAEGLQVQGRRCLDVGASTGGFTQVLLERGARQVIALDVGHGQLHPTLVQDPRVHDLPGVNIRSVLVETIGRTVDLVVSDVSFISLSHVLPALPPLCTPGADVVVLVKPQFEVGRTQLGRQGVVRSAQARSETLERVEKIARAHSLVPMGLERSPVTGSTGNIEYVLWLRVCPPGMMDCGLSEVGMSDRRAALRQEEER